MSSDLSEPSIRLGYAFVTLDSIKPFKINKFMKQSVADLVEDIKDAHEIYAYSQLWIYKVSICGFYVIFLVILMLLSIKS